MVQIGVNVTVKNRIIVRIFYWKDFIIERDFNKKLLILIVSF